MKLKFLLRKGIILFYILLSLNVKISAQTTVVIEAKDNKDNITLTTKPKTLNARDSCKIIIKGLNSAKYKVTIEPKFTRKKVDVPAVLSAVIPLLSGSEEKTFVHSKDIRVKFSDGVRNIHPKIHEPDKTKAKEDSTRQNKLDTTLATVFKNIEKNADILEKLSNDFDTLYNKTDSTKIVDAARRILYNASTEKEVAINLKKYDQDIRNAINGFNANTDLLKVLVNNFSLEKFSLTFIEEFTNAKASSQFVIDHKDVLLKMVEFIGDAAISKQQIEFPNTAITGDFTSIEVTVIKTKKDLTTKTLTAKKDFNNYGYIKWLNITGGFFGNTLVSRDFSISSDKSSIITEKHLKYDVAIGAMANVNYVVTPKFKVGLGLGVGVSPFDGKTRYMTGATLTFGVQNEFAISGGFAWAKLQVLSSTISSNGYDYDRPLNPTVVTATVDKGSTNTSTGVLTPTHDVTTTSTQNTFSAIPTYGKWFRGGFISVTYSFLKR